MNLNQKSPKVRADCTHGGNWKSCRGNMSTVCWSDMFVLLEVEKLQLRDIVQWFRLHENLWTTKHFLCWLSLSNADLVPESLTSAASCSLFYLINGDFHEVKYAIMDRHICFCLFYLINQCKFQSHTWCNDHSCFPQIEILSNCLVKSNGLM